MLRVANLRNAMWIRTSPMYMCTSLADHVPAISFVDADRLTVVSGLVTKAPPLLLWVSCRTGGFKDSASNLSARYDGGVDAGVGPHAPFTQHRCPRHLPALEHMAQPDTRLAQPQIDGRPSAPEIHAGTRVGRQTIEMYKDTSKKINGSRNAMRCRGVHIYIYIHLYMFICVCATMPTS